MSSIDFDTSLFPVVVVRFPSTPLTDEDVDTMIAFWEKLFATAPTQYAVILDTGAIAHQALSAGQRKRVSEWEKLHATETRRCNLGVAVLIQSALVRGIYTAIRWLSPGVTPETTVASLEEGFDDALRRLEAANVEVPARVRDARSRFVRA